MARPPVPLSDSLLELAVKEGRGNATSEPVGRQLCKTSCEYVNAKRSSLLSSFIDHAKLTVEHLQKAVAENLN